MFWSMFWPWRRAKKVPARRTPSKLQLAVETLEDRLVPSTNPAYDAWRQQTFQVDDATVGASIVRTSDQASSATTQGNASFGNLIGLPSAFNSPYRGDGYSVAVIDTGIDYNNPSLGGGFGRRVIAGWDFANNDADPMDDNGHGTHVAGIIGSSDATYSGVAPNVNLIALKVLDASGSGSFGNVENALNWVIANRARYNIVAINLSLGAGNYTSNPYTFLDDEFASLKNAGVFISVAAGNSFYSNNSAVGLDFPAVDPLVVSVGAVYSGDFGSVAWGSGARDYTTGADHIASFSQRGPALSIMAPGAMITSTYLNNTFKVMAGTSMAAPVVAGASVLIHQAMDAKHLIANEDTILNVMKTTGARIVDGDDENDNVVNTGLAFQRLDVGAALASLQGPSNSAPVLQAIANTTVAPGGTRIVTLSASDADGDAITFSASVIGATSSPAYQFKTQLGLSYIGSYFQNYWGQNEKWLFSNLGWYCILPNGQLRHWAGSMTATLQAANLTASLDAKYYTSPNLLWNAQPASATMPSLSIAGNQLTISVPSGTDATYQIEVSASDGKATAAQSFTLSMQTNTAPQISSLSTQTIMTGRSQTVTLKATDAQNDAISYTAKILGTFSTPPASISILGNQMTINVAANFSGSFNVLVTASDGSLSSSTNCGVNVSAAALAFQLGGDFNGDGLQDVASLSSDGAWWVSVKNANGSYVNRTWTAWNPPSSVAVLKTGDFNGDGKTDVVAWDWGGAIWVGINTGSAFAVSLWTQWSSPTAWLSFNVADLNGDGKLDLYGQNSSGKWYAAYSTGANFRTEQIVK